MKRIFNKIANDYNLDNNGSCDVLLEKYRKYIYIDNDYELFYNYYFDGTLQRWLTKQKHKKNIIVKNKKLYINENNQTTTPIAIHFPKNSINKKIIKDLGYNYNVKLDQSIGYLLKDYFKHYNEYMVKYYAIILIIFIYKFI